MKILGIHLGHDSSACLLKEGEVIFAEEEERATGEKNYFGYPHKVINYIETKYLKSNETFDVISIGWNMHELENGRQNLTTLKVDKQWCAKKLENAKKINGYYKYIKNKYSKCRIVEYDHHLCHSASVLPFSDKKENYFSLVLDAYGEKDSGALLKKMDNSLFVVANIPLEKSIGYFYQRWAEVFGYRGKQACGYFMSLAGYGDVQKNKILFENTFIERNNEKGYLELNNFLPYSGNNENAHLCFPEYFIKTHISDYLNDFNKKADYAAAVQHVIEKIVISHLEFLKGNSKEINSILLSGGVFMNCMLLSRIHDSNIFEKVFTTPSAKDSGISIGAAILANCEFGNKQIVFKKNPYLGRNITVSKKYFRKRIPESSILCHGKIAVSRCVDLLLENKSVAVVDGNLEFGPRALGARSILMSPFKNQNKDILNRVKSREWFQPVAISISSKTAKEFYNVMQDEPFMNRNALILDEKREIIPAALHADSSSRIHIINGYCPYLIKEILSELGERKLPEVLLNTSFNPKGKPLPASPDQSLKYYCELDVDYFFINGYLIYLNNNEKMKFKKKYYER